jgi:phosphoribosylformylglycinamidine cyclo-ligase
MYVRYADAGVDLSVAEDISARLKKRVGGLFGGFVPVSELKSYEEPVLVSSIDGVGTKVRLAAALNRMDVLGFDLVHHCVNDIAVHGARPLFFLDYLAFHRLDAGVVEVVVDSIASACESLDIRLAGGETAEMPSVYGESQFDIAGAVVGVVEQDAIVDGAGISEGDMVIGLPSSGVHTNGFSLVQALFPVEALKSFEPTLGVAVGEALLIPHRCYLKDIRTLIATGAVHGLAHITGGGIEGNLSRIIPTGLQAEIRLPAAPPIFALIQQRGVSTAEMRRVFNMGFGMIAVCDPAILAQIPAEYVVIGSIGRTKKGERRVTFND